MKTQYILISSIKSIIVVLLFSSMAFAQNTDDAETKTDTIVYKQKYGLRLGADASKLIRTLIDDNYTGFEIMGDYRLTKRIYLAGELGTEERKITNEVLTNTTTGSYFKAGVDYNFYQNWLDMENMIYVGFRAGASTFSQSLDNFTVYDINNQYFGQQFSVNEATEFDGLTAFWGEILLGLKAEVFNNLFIGLNVQLKVLISDDKPDNYENLYIPGFNRTYDSNRIGAGYGLNVSYLVPIFKKDKIIVKDVVEKE